jgi:hypothetical protein
MKQSHVVRDGSPVMTKLTARRIQIASDILSAAYRALWSIGIDLREVASIFTFFFGPASRCSLLRFRLLEASDKELLQDCETTCTE